MINEIGKSNAQTEELASDLEQYAGNAKMVTTTEFRMALRKAAKRMRDLQSRFDFFDETKCSLEYEDVGWAVYRHSEKGYKELAWVDGAADDPIGMVIDKAIQSNDELTNAEGNGDQTN